METKQEQVIPSPLYECVFDGKQFVLLSEYEDHYTKEHEEQNDV